MTATPIGFTMGVSRIARGLLDPPIEFYRPLPPLAYLPLVAIWSGIDERTKIVVICLACSASVAMAAHVDVHSATLEQVSATYALDANFTQVVRHVILLMVLPEVLTSLRIAIDFSRTTFVVAEMVAATVGVGQTVPNAPSFLCTNLTVMGIMLIGAIAWAFDLVIRAIEARMVSWKSHS